MTDAQRSVVESDAPHLFVTAAAGSGKTRVLVERYLRLVREGLSPDSILTITFTRKAAAEMKSRIVRALSEEGRNEAAQTAETGPIQTIHGFCERILRENAIAAGLDPRFDILDGRQKQALQSSAISRSLANPLDDEDDGLVQGLLETLAGRQDWNGSIESPHSTLMGAVAGLLAQLRGTHLTPGHLEAMGRDPTALIESWTETILDSVPTAVRSAMEPGAEFFVSLRSAFRATKIAVPAWLKSGDGDGLQAARHTCALLRLAADSWIRMEGEMRSRGALDFVLLERLAVELVETSEVVRDRLLRQYQAIFIDEAQDLNPMQYRLLDALPSNNRMFVGDIQQSIYGFRLADVELFKRHPEVHALDPIQLQQNFRSTPGILTFIDELFSNIWTETYERMLEPNVVLLESAPKRPMGGVEVWPFETPDAVLVSRLIADLVADTGAAQDVCVLVRTSQFGNNVARQLERFGVRSRVVGGTDEYYTRMEIRDVANALRALTNPHDDFALLATLRSPFVGISLDAFVLLAHRSDHEASVFERIGSTELPPSDRALVDSFLKWFEPLSSYADRLSAWEAISELFAASPFLANLGRRQNRLRLLANVRKLLSLAAAAPDTAPDEFAEQVRETQRLKHKEGEAPVDDEDADAVTIMTVHKAKGLEFPVVVVPETFKQVTSKSFRDVLVDARVPMVVTRFGRSKTVFSEYLAERQAQRDSQEEWRVLYVALTRAKSRLCVVVDPQKRKERFAGAMADALRLKLDEPPEGLRVRTPEV